MAKFIINRDNKSLLVNIFGSLTIKGGALIVSLATLPAYISYFDNQQILGIWFTLLSVLTWILTFDFGVGNGLRNNLVKAFVYNDHVLAKKYISSAYFFMGLLSLVTISIFLLVSKYIDWKSVFNITELSISSKTFNLAIVIVFVSIILQLFLKLINSILYAMQKSALTNLLTLLTSILVLIYVANFGSLDTSTNLINLALVYLIAVNAPLLIATIIAFKTTLSKSKPNFKYLDKKIAKNIFVLGGVFFWIQIMFMFITTTNEFLITWFFDPAMVVEYQVYNKLFTLIGTLFSIGLIPIWSAVTKAIAEKNYLWIKKIFSVLKLLTLAAILVEFTLVILLQDAINYWLGKDSLEVNYKYAIIFAISGSLFIWNGVISSIVNGLGKLKVQAIFLTFGAILKIPLSIVLMNYFDSWIGVIVANVIAMSIYCIIQPITLEIYLNKKVKGDKNYV
ncbi:polysaccharide biosynthesis C-terminal domain-containing protein [Planomicrobium sp. MB-3u-38]|uniref:polysaccharide biosynthesis C-terminal domain-containing protein n=1 Tax=Planomicrobium sp. MB-3u-38 TaxID=2058318 RepID=UPI000C7D717D|nr:polysaccharide biosynthesis C-terminal domain-containing protein [Planomicrobium sp. MB-3u-38]PKH10177.1 hypothetical protein CXF70_10385 [Planomicrobium sp. MB-3u-38]